MCYFKQIGFLIFHFMRDHLDHLDTKECEKDILHMTT